MVTKDSLTRLVEEVGATHWAVMLRYNSVDTVSMCHWVWVWQFF